MKNKRIFLTGVTGFLGGHLYEDLCSRNYPLCVALRLSDHRFSNAAQVAVGDINSQTDWSEFPEDVDTIVHCAGRAHVMSESELDPLKAYMEVNFDGTINLAKTAIQKGVRRFIFISTIKVNGEETSGDLPLTASQEVSPKEPYAVSKYMAEKELISLAKKSDMDVIIIRPPLIYGPGVKANFLSMVKLASKKIPVPFGALNQNKRSMIYVKNLTDFIIHCIKHKNINDEVFLVSDGKDLSTSEMFRLLSKLTGGIGFQIPIPIFMFKILGVLFKRQSIIKRLCSSLQVDLDYTKQKLDWSPPFSVEQGFSSVVNDYRKTLELN